MKLAALGSQVSDRGPLGYGERGCLVVNASDSGYSGRGFEPHSSQTVLCPGARQIYSPKVLVIPRKRWLRPNMTERLFTGTLRINHPTNLWDTCFIGISTSGLRTVRNRLLA